MDITLEQTRRGSDTLPLGLYRQSRSVPGACITPPHYHKDLEILLALEGCTVLTVDGEAVETAPGTLYFIDPYQIHSLHAGTPPSRYDCLVIPLSLLSLPAGHGAMVELIDPIYSGRLSFARQTDDPFLIGLFRQITGMYAQKEQHAAAITACLLLFLDHCRKHTLLIEAAAKPTPPIRKAMDHIQRNFASKLSLADVAAAAGMNEKYFCTYFKKHTRTTPMAYVTMLRIRHAKLLLQENRLSVLEVALSCGFDNVSFFIRQFKKATGRTPGQYRRSAGR